MFSLFLILLSLIPVVPLAALGEDQNLTQTRIETTTMKPWVLLLNVIIYGVVMPLPVLGGLRNKTFCRWYGKGGGVSAQARDVWCS